MFRIEGVGITLARGGLALFEAIVHIEDPRHLGRNFGFYCLRFMTYGFHGLIFSMMYGFYG